MNAARKSSSPPSPWAADDDRNEASGIRQVGTHIVDRTTFFQRLDAEIARTWCTSVVVFELDDFEAIDRTAGHAAGDLVVEQVVRVARGLVRPQDVIAQLGRAELGIGLGGVALGEGRAYADRLRTCIGALRVPFEHHLLRVTISAGVASSIEGVKDARALYYRADNRLQAARLRISAA